MHLVPFYNRSLLDNVDSMFDDLMWDSMNGMTLIPANSRRQGGQSRNWSTTLRLPGFSPNQVKIEKSPDNGIIKIHAKQDNGEDYDEVKRTIKVPEEVERDKLETSFTREGILLIKAPYKQSNLEQQMDVFRPFASSIMPFHDWGYLTQEMRDLERYLGQIMHQSMPGTGNLATRVVKSDDGNHMLKMEFDLRGYKPEEIEIHQKDNKLSVEAKHESRSENSFSSKHFKRDFMLPENVKLDKMVSKLQPNGVLALEAPCTLKDQPMMAIEGKEIPVKRS